MDAVLADPEAAPISEAEKVLLRFVARVNGASYTLRRADVDHVIAVGWSEEAVYDAITVCALFNFYNRWIDSTGVHALSEEAHRAGGKRMKTGSYARE